MPPASKSVPQPVSSSPRFTTWRLTAFVAVVGTLLSGAGALSTYHPTPADFGSSLLIPGDSLEIRPWEWFLAGCAATAIVSLLVALDRARRLRGLPLMTTRHLIVVVALVAIVAALPAFLGRRSNASQELAEFHGRQRQSVPLKDLEFYLLFTHGSYDSKEETDRIRKRTAAAQPLFEFFAYHDRLQEKYTKLARHPWRFRGVDPPPPPKPSEELLNSLRNDVSEIVGKSRSSR